VIANPSNLGIFHDRRQFDRKLETLRENAAPVVTVWRTRLRYLSAAVVNGAA
jgi:hypothetical protein